MKMSGRLLRAERRNRRMEAFVQTIIGFFTWPFALLKDARQVNRTITKHGNDGVRRGNIVGCLVLLVAGAGVTWKLNLVGGITLILSAFVALFLNRESAKMIFRLCLSAALSTFITFILALLGLFTFGVNGISAVVLAMVMGAIYLFWKRFLEDRFG